LGTDAAAIPRPRAAAPVERWYVLIVMCAVYAINIAARYVVTTVFEPIRLELALTDAGAAFLTGVPLALFYVTFGIPMGWLADRSNRRNIVALSLIVWSGFTMVCGLSQSYWQLLIGRIGVGVGEAGATPSSGSLVSDYFPADRRLMALSVLALGAPIGAWLGADWAGAVAQAYGWRSAFFALGAPGVLLGLLVFMTIREPKRGRRCHRRGKQDVAGRVTQVPVAPAGRLPRDHGERGVLSLGLGPRVVDTDFPHAHL